MNVVAVNGLENQAAKLLNFKEKLDVDLLDKVITSLYSGEGPQVIISRFLLNIVLYMILLSLYLKSFSLAAKLYSNQSYLVD